MHELSIALGIVEIAENEGRKANTKHVESIELQIGELSGVELESLDFAWPVAVKDTILEHAERHIDVVSGLAKCLDCETEFSLTHVFDACPNCKSYFKNILHGQELRVKALSIT